MLTINLQPDLHRDALNAEFLADAAFRYGLTPADILIELTEDRRLSTSDYNKLMCQHKSAGFATVMDDFGAGYSGLSTLVECTPQILKLDRALIRDIDTCEVRQEIVKAFNNSCKALRITVVAEGIEKREEADMLLKIGVHTMQGYLFSRPVLNALPTAIHWHDDPRPFLGSGNVLSAFTVPLGLRDPFQPITLPA
jgi:EAL domain-containing protein (putative c-di-GMP-specific phosphodiesterase class I)